MTEERILIVEDDPAIALGLVDTLEFEGFEVCHANEGAKALSELGSGGFDCVVLDIMLPDMNGFDVCRKIREKNRAVPILMLSARSQESDKIRGLDAGADDYVTKPFSVGELVARLRALLRRASRSTNPLGEMIAIGDAILDPVQQVLTRGETVQQLSFYEVETLKLLHARVGQPVSREELLKRVWGVEASPNNRTVDNLVVKLRKRIEEKPDAPRHILTVYGMGYKLVP